MASDQRYLFASQKYNVCLRIANNIVLLAGGKEQRSILFNAELYGDYAVATVLVLLVRK